MPSGCHARSVVNRRASRLGPKASAGLALVVYGGFALVLTRGAWHAPQSSLACSNADCIQAAWLLQWVAFAVAHLRDPLVTTYLSPPGHPIGLMWNDAAPLLGLLLTPITLAFGGLLSYNLGITAALALSAWSAFLVLGEVTRHRPAAFAGGVVFGFSPWAVGEAMGGHLFLVSAFLLPPLFLALVRVVTGAGGRRQPVLLGLLAAAQFLISAELLADWLLLGALVAGGLAIAGRGRIPGRVAGSLRRLGLAAAVFLVVVAVPLVVAALGPGHALHGRLENPSRDAGNLLGLILPRVQQLLAPPGAPYVTAAWDSFWGGNIYLGLPLLVVVGWAGWRLRSDPWVRGAAALSAAAIVLAMGPMLRVGGHATTIPLPWAVLVHLPVYGLMVPARITPFAFLGAAVCLAALVDRLWPTAADPRLTRPAALAAACLLPLVPAAPITTWVFATPSYFTSAALRAIPADSLAAVAPPGPVNLDAMLWQIEAGLRFRLPWGYAIQQGSGGVRAAFAPAGPLETALMVAARGQRRALTIPAPAIRKQLAAWGARAVVVGPMPHRQLAVALVARALGTPPRRVGGVAVWILGATRRLASRGQRARAQALPRR